MRLQTAFIVISTFAIGSMQAKAEEAPSKVFESYGLTGTWSAGCGQAAGPRNLRIRYEQRPDGLVDIVRDSGADGLSRSTVLQASIDQDRRLHTTSYTKFAELPKQAKDMVQKFGLMPDVTTRSISVMGSDGSFAIVDQVADTLGGTRTMYVISDGFFINQQTHERGAKGSVNFKCSS